MIAGKDANVMVKLRTFVTGTAAWNFVAISQFILELFLIMTD
jgi:hypothetical protein